MQQQLIVVRGGGDLATGVIHRLVCAGWPVLVLETPAPAAIRRTVAFSEAIYEGRVTVEGVTAVRIQAADGWRQAVQAGFVPVLADPAGEAIGLLRPFAVVDAILAKRNLGTHRGMAPLTIALGPGFVAGQDVDAVVETQRGHDLGRIIRAGVAAPNTGVPGVIAGHGADRVLYAPAAGILQPAVQIGSEVQPGQPLAYIQPPAGCAVAVCAPFAGLVRGMLRPGTQVPKGFKLADIDPRAGQYRNCFTISDKARCIAGSVLELVCAAALANV